MHALSEFIVDVVTHFLEFTKYVMVSYLYVFIKHSLHANLFAEAYALELNFCMDPGLTDLNGGRGNASAEFTAVLVLFARPLLDCYALGFTDVGVDHFRQPKQLMVPYDMFPVLCRNYIAISLPGD